MKRRLLSVLLLLVAGAIVNVAVAWSITLVHQKRLQVSPLMSIVATVAVQVQSRTDFSGIVSVHEEDHCGFRFEQSIELPEILLTSRFSSGWPLKSMRGDLLTSTSGMVAASPNQVIAFAGSSWLLPVVATWPGFAINTVFYAGVLWLLFAAPFALRRLRGGRRIKRGLCPKCAYDLRGAGSDSATCPECGATVNRIAR